MILVVNMKYERLIFIRESLNLNQREMANLLGISKSNYARWETKKKIIPLKHLIKICNLSKITLDYALALTDTKQKRKINIDFDSNILGKKLKNIRLQYHLTQKAFAASIHTTQSVILEYENGLNVIQTSFLYEICQKYNLSADELVSEVN